MDDGPYSYHVRNWITPEDLVNQDIVLMPFCNDLHWGLCILVDPGGSPGFLYFDSSPGIIHWTRVGSSLMGWLEYALGFEASNVPFLCSKGKQFCVATG